MEKRIEELKQKLHAAEQNYKDTRADAYLVEQHQLKEKIATLESMTIDDRSNVAPDSAGDDSKQVSQTEFVVPTNVDELPSAITRHIMAALGGKTDTLTNEQIAQMEKELIEKAREFYDRMNDKDAVVRVVELNAKVDATLAKEDDGGNDDSDDESGDGEESADEKTPTEATETATAAPQTPKPTKTTAAKKKPTSGKKNGGKATKKK